MTLTVLHVPDCPNAGPLLDRLREVTTAPVEVRVVETEAEAVALGMAGSPTLLVDGHDPFGTPQACECGLSCRLYRDEHDRPVAVPSIAQLRTAVAPGNPVVASGNDHVEVLSAWRRRAVPLTPDARAVHHAILRAFATTGHPPPPADLTDVPALLRELHELDAIRLGPDGVIAVAYPFSAATTRHRVRVGGKVDVHAMCAIDALGIAPMLGTDTRIDSVDVTTGRRITVLTINGRTHWDPADAVVFVGAETGGGPSADCCCDYLNFFEDRTAATAWTSTHSAVPGQILTQPAPEALAARLFAPLLR